MTLAIDSTVRLSSGTKIPRLAFGVWPIKAGPETQKAVQAALSAGYRHIDTAQIYGNEADVGEAVRASGVPRDEVFVTSKVWNENQGYDATLDAFEQSLSRFKFKYLDLYLVHWPVERLRNDTWKALQKLQKDGKVRAIGVSNFMTNHLEELLAGTDVVPEVNQIEFHPFLYQKQILEFCRENKIAFEAYSPLATGTKLADPKLEAIAKRHGKSPAQVMLRWGLQKATVVIPRSTNADHIRQNTQLFDFELSTADVAAIDAWGDGHRVGWDPTKVP